MAPLVNLNLQPSIKTNADGLYYVMVANHQGETRGDPWRTDLTCLAVDATNLTIEQTNALFSQAPTVHRF